VSSTTHALSEIEIEGSAVATFGASDSGTAAGSMEANVVSAMQPSIIESSFANSRSDVSLNVLKQVAKAENEFVPNALQRLVDFFVRSLLLLSERIDETTKWTEKLAAQQEQIKRAKSKARKEGSSGATDISASAAATLLEDEDYKAMLALSEEAELLDLCCSKRYASHCIITQDNLLIYLIISFAEMPLASS